ncbi:MAG: tetratricopeptide repeat protein [Thermoguttaceae bacterium]
MRAEAEALKKESLEIGQRLIQEYPDSVDGVNLLAKVHYRCGEGAKAWQYWEQAWSRDPSRADACAGLASIAHDKGEHEKVVELCRKGLAQTPGSVYLLRQLAQALNWLGRPEEAVPELRRAIEIMPKDAASHMALGQSYAMLGEFEKAKASYETAVKLEPGDQRAYLGLATACAKLRLEDQSKRAMGQYETRNAAFLQFQRTRRDISFDVARSRRCLAQTCWEAVTVYLRRQNTAKIEGLLRRGAELDPQSIKFRFELAMFLVSVQRGPEAIATLKELIAAYPARAEFYALLADAQAQSKRPDDAISAAKKATELDPNNGIYRRMLERLEARR